MEKNRDLSNRSCAEMKHILSAAHILIERFEKAKSKKLEEKEKKLKERKEWKKSGGMY